MLRAQVKEHYVEIAEAPSARILHALLAKCVEMWHAHRQERVIKIWCCYIQTLFRKLKRQGGHSNAWHVGRCLVPYVGAAHAVHSLHQRFGMCIRANRCAALIAAIRLAQRQTARLAERAGQRHVASQAGATIASSR